MIYRFRDLTVNTETQEVYRGEERLEVTGLNFRLLAYFMVRGTQIASFDEIIQSVWVPSQVSNETVTQRIRLLRVALDDHQKKSKYIRSVRGTGYQLCETPTESVKSTSSTTDQGPSHSRAFPRFISVCIGLSACVIATWIYLSGWMSNSKSEVVSLYEQRMARAQYFLKQREAEDIERALALLAQIELDGKNDPKWLLAKSVSLSTKVCRFGAALVVADEAEDLAESAIAFNGDKAQALAALAYNYDCRGDTQKAINMYRQAIEHSLDPEFGVYSALAYLLGETGHVSESLAIHKRLESEGRSDAFLYLQLARNYALLQYDDLAMQYYRLSFDLYPENLFSNLAYPMFLFSQGLFEQSSQILAIAENRPQHADLHVLKAELYILNNQPTRSLNALKQATAAKADFPFYRTLLELHQSEPDPQMLRMRLEEIVTDSSMQTQAIAHLEAALINTQLGKIDAAQKALTDAIRAGYLDSGYLNHSNMLASLRELPGYNDAIIELNELVAKQRALVPADQLLLTMIE